MKRVVFDTVGKLADEGYSLNLWCHACKRGKTVTFEAVANHFGRDSGIDLQGKFTCSRCGSKDIGFGLSAPTVPQ